jgi:hypothetical protein
MDWEPSSSDKSFSSQNRDVSDLSLNYVTQFPESPQGIRVEDVLIDENQGDDMWGEGGCSSPPTIFAIGQWRHPTHQ